jgi:hypothetical protein
MYFADLDLCFYHPGPLDAYGWQVPLRAVGWLEHPHEFTKGRAPHGLVAKIREMAEQTSVIYSGSTFRGLHRCSHCVAAGLQASSLSGSHVNIFVPGTTVVYAAPAGIVHYIEDHSYLPPREFVEALLRCPDCRSDSYRTALRAANRGVEPPLKVTKPFKVAKKKTGTLLNVVSEHCERMLDGSPVRDDATYYTIDDGEQYIYVLKRTLRRDATELAVTLNAPVRFGLMYEEIGDEVLMTDAYGGSHILSLHERYPRTDGSGDNDETKTVC